MRKRHLGLRLLPALALSLAVLVAIALAVAFGILLDRQNTAVEGLTLRLTELESHLKTMEVALKQVRTQEQMPVTPFPKKLRRFRRSFVELRAYLNAQHDSYNFGTAGYLGHGYFITVKHNVTSLKDPSSLKPLFNIGELAVRYRDTDYPVQLIDQGSSEGIHGEIDDQDWAIVKADEEFDLIPLAVNLNTRLSFGDLVVRFGNDYNKGIIATTGYIGSPLEDASNILPCLTDGNPGLSGGGVLNQDGDLVGLGLGRLGEGYRLTLILPLRPEMFEKVAFIRQKPVAASGQTR